MTGFPGGMPGDASTGTASGIPDSATARRRNAMLRTALGPVIGAALAEEDVIEIMANPDGGLWIERRETGRRRSELALAPQEAERIVRLVASHVGVECGETAPIVSAELPETGERFEGVLPPVSRAPCFAIRRPAGAPRSLADYERDGILAAGHRRALAEAVRARRSIVVAGGTGSGKTTLANALLAEIAETGDRVVILEDTRELVCAARDAVALRTRPGTVSLRDLVRTTMRLRPDRIVVGEVRGGEALDLLKAWNTGHPGGIATLHANSAAAALHRLEQLVEEAVAAVPRRLIAEAVDVVVFIAGHGGARRVETVAELRDVSSNGGYRLVPLSAPPAREGQKDRKTRKSRKTKESGESREFRKTGKPRKTRQARNLRAVPTVPPTPAVSPTPAASVAPAAPAESRSARNDPKGTPS